MRRGDIVLVAAGSGFGGKPRPAVVVQSDDFRDIGSFVLCLMTSEAANEPLFRLPLAPTAANGLELPAWIMVDKVVTVRPNKLGRRIGTLGSEDTVRLNRALLVFLGLAGG